MCQDSYPTHSTGISFSVTSARSSSSNPSPTTCSPVPKPPFEVSPFHHFLIKGKDSQFAQACFQDTCIASSLDNEDSVEPIYLYPRLIKMVTSPDQRLCSLSFPVLEPFSGVHPKVFSGTAWPSSHHPCTLEVFSDCWPCHE